MCSNTLCWGDPILGVASGAACVRDSNTVSDTKQFAAVTARGRTNGEAIYTFNVRDSVVRSTVSVELKETYS